MNAAEQIPAPRHKLCLHRGGYSVTREEISIIPTPSATSSWTPVPHLKVVETVEKALDGVGLRLGNHSHSLSHEGNRYFGLIEVFGSSKASDYGWVIGLRNSHDKTFPAGIVAGAKVFVCDNLSFSGEVKLARRHTSHILRDLPLLGSRAVERLMHLWNHQDLRIAAYKEAVIDSRTAHDLVIRAVDVGACTNRLVPTVLNEWRNPRHNAFKPQNTWSLFNAFTGTFKGNLPELPRRTEALHALFDAHVGLALSS